MVLISPPEQITFALDLTISRNSWTNWNFTWTISSKYWIVIYRMKAGGKVKI
ncbi:hypothetical protein FGIG_12595 [Fasciola gigantica]|uniref:Uncharacterized protein n=1 Tax=Fasciola gigantica TaxID=46835 RepID=A0A504X0B6_FASGI|nr:hypothetical protein FGIG_12595 [Fasciola gigantica]